MSLADVLAGGALTAAGGLGGSVLTSWLQSKRDERRHAHELSMAREDRSQQRKAEAYVDLLDFVTREELRAGLVTPKLSTGTEQALMHDPMSGDSWWRMHVRVRAFASPEMISAVDELLTVRIRLNSGADVLAQLRQTLGNGPHDKTTIEQMTEMRQSVEEARTTTLAACQRIAELAAAELQGDAASRLPSAL